MEPTALALLVAAAFATSVVSAILGLAGGMILLTLMLFTLEPMVAIPLHGAVQLVSNGARTWFQRRHVEIGIVWRYCLLLVPGGLVGLALFRDAPAELVKALIGAFVLLATWAPGWLLLGAHPERADPRRRFVWLGGVIGVLNMGVGATGPLSAPFFLQLGLARQAIVGTSATCQAAGHLAKIAIFAGAGFAFVRWLPELALLSAAVVAGTWVGTRLLHRVDERSFRLAFRTVLTLLALRLLLADALDWLLRT